jgi:hypothetical protein
VSNLVLDSVPHCYGELLITELGAGHNATHYFEHQSATLRDLLLNRPILHFVDS